MKSRRRYEAPRLDTVNDANFSPASDALRALQAANTISQLTIFSIDSVLSLLTGAPTPEARPSVPTVEAT